MNTISIPDALRIVQRHQHKYPVKLAPIAEDLGIPMYLTSGWDKNISGKLQRDERAQSGYSIHINQDDPHVRQRFTAAHEIAHYILHRDLIKNGVLVDDALYRSDLSTRVEVQANALAAEILMPWKFINDLMDTGITDVGSLAEKLDVSKSAMSIRLGIPVESESGR